MKQKKETILGVRVEADLEAQIKTLAEEEDRSVSWMIRHLILEGLKAKETRGQNGCGN
ncbi:MAG: ribbon-helix-helix protein, CopG family [Verrucomicrobia bacterium]|nr:ribbon-helix-helix protein, CopG family [Verrucomicrobiota bacterium]